MDNVLLLDAYILPLEEDITLYIQPNFFKFPSLKNNFFANLVEIAPHALDKF